MFPKIQGFMNNFMVQPVDTVTSRGTRGVECTGQNHFAGAVSGGQMFMPSMIGLLNMALVAHNIETVLLLVKKY